MNDGAAVFLTPLPHAFHKGFATQVLATLAFLAKGLFHHVLRCDTGMVRARHPTGVVAAHTVPTHQDVLNGLV